MNGAAVAALTSVALLAPARPVALPATWTVVDHGARGGTTYGGPPVDGVGAVYLPAGIPAGGRVPVAYVLTSQSPATVARALGVAHIGDQLSWQRTTPRFAVVLASPRGRGALARALRFAQAALPITGSAAGRTVIGLGAAGRAAVEAARRPQLRVGTGIAIGGRASATLLRRLAHGAPPRRVRRLSATAALGPVTARLWQRRLVDALAYAFARPGAEHAADAAAAVAPPGWVRVSAGPFGGTVWQGVIPDAADRNHPRASLVYLPPGVRRQTGYPAVYLLHGLRGSPYSFIGGLRLAAVADGLIHAREVPPFVAVMPPAGSTPRFDGEWTGAWERSLVQGVLPWAERHLPLSPRPADRTLAGFSAGAYGSIDIGLRHPGLFGTVESWSGYFRAPHDGSLATATKAQRLAHDPAMLVRSQAGTLRADRTRIFLSAGLQERAVLTGTRAFAAELTALGVGHVVHIGAGGHHGSTWRDVLPAGLRYALTR